MRFDGKCCVVTGAGRGIGAAIARAFGAEGAAVICADIDRDAAIATAAACAGAAFTLNVGSEADWTAFAKAHPQIDILVNNAAITGFEGGPVAHDPAGAALVDWRAVHAVNLDGVFLGCRTAIGLMRERGGAIVNIGSRSGAVGVAAAAAYASAKAAVMNHTRSVALYCAEQGLNIRCNAILPGAVRTPIWEPILKGVEDRDAAEAAIVARVPLRRFTEPEEIAAAALFLASDAAPSMTGAAIAIDGGLSAKGG